jgi:hypothetical protein
MSEENKPLRRVPILLLWSFSVALVGTAVFGVGFHAGGGEFPQPTFVPVVGVFGFVIGTLLGFMVGALWGRQRGGYALSFFAAIVVAGILGSFVASTFGGSTTVTRQGDAIEAHHEVPPPVWILGGATGILLGGLGIWASTSFSKRGRTTAVALMPIILGGVALLLIVRSILLGGIDWTLELFGG